MNAKNIIIDLLYQNKGQFISSGVLCEKLGVSRIAIWQHIEKIKNLGYVIEAKRGKGYRLIEVPQDPFNDYELNKLFKDSEIVRHVYFFNTTTSTMDEAKKILNINKTQADKSLIVALKQTQGKGRKNRQWLSVGDNIYASYIYLPVSMNLQDGLLVMFANCIAICQVLNEIGAGAKIKWPNDCIVNDKKIAGTLLDIKGDASMLTEMVMGFGVNVNWSDIPQELNATSVFEHTNRIVSRLSLLNSIIHNLQKLIQSIEGGAKERIFVLWKSHQATLNRQVEIVSDNRLIRGIAKDIDEYGFLLVQTKDGIQRVITSDTVRFV